MKLWRKSYKATGSFRLLSIGARGLFRELMTELADDDGVIDIGRKAPHEAICFALGATRSDRQQVRKWLAELLEDGCVVALDGALLIPNFRSYQDDQATPKSIAAAKKRRRSADHRTDEPQPFYERPKPLEQPSDDLSSSKGAESLVRDGQRREEERREEESASHSQRGRAGPRSSVDCPDPLGEHKSVSSAELPWRAWVAVSRARGISPTDADRRRDMRHVEDVERRVLELAPLMAERRGLDVGEAAKSLTMTALKRFGDAFDAERAPDAKGRPRLEWRLGWVVSRWAELTAGAIPKEVA